VRGDIAELWRAYQAMSGLIFIRLDFMVTVSGEQLALEANHLPAYDSYDRRPGFTISEGFNVAPQACLPRRRRRASPHPIFALVLTTRPRWSYSKSPVW
jgi:hypothetical protein